MDDRDSEIAEGIRLARRGAEYGRDDAVALARSGHALLHLAGEMDAGIALLDRALVLNPNLAFAWALGGYARMWDGDIDGALARFTHAMRLSPLDPEMYRMKAGIAAAHMFAGRYDLASSWAEEAFLQMPGFLMVLAVIAASHGMADFYERPAQGGPAGVSHLQGGQSEACPPIWLGANRDAAGTLCFAHPTFPHCERSEATQHSESLDCFGATLLGMTEQRLTPPP
jgi:tetratricopeptide (TPR) repeat protein